MSPSWRDRVEAFIAPRGVHLARIRRGLRPRADPEVFVAGIGDEGWLTAVEALARALPGLASKGAEVRVTVSNRFVRYASVPGIETLAADAEREALARHQFQAIHGARAAGWRVAIAEHGSRAAGLGAAIDAELLDALATTVTAAGLTLRSVEPLLVSAFNACRREIGSEPAWLVVAEPERLCIARISHGRWVEVRNLRAPRGPVEELPQVLEQMRLTGGATPGVVHVVSREPLDAAIDAGPGWRVQVVELSSAVAAARQKAA